LAAGDTNRAPSYFREHRRHSSLNDWFALRFAEVHGGILLTGDGDPRRIAIGNGVEVHGALWAVVLTADHATCLRGQLTGALDVLYSNPLVRLPPTLSGRRKQNSVAPAGMPSCRMVTA
jgi:hypothetical protein